ncbi:hypothetical protein Bca52824_046686 [Brassica carinata]|uniref:Plastocyanin-like domain-containing protein n=1 Tax=Brassica carinata TaxID=52824 RepID=A0A8X7RFV7_BRACI|nr:hypothetical protein Bca52824_046685 [Brassica carinata]KAG2287082.1 hypothetical protein Bca52824_046686 [Brassica carinata]
MNPFVLEVVPSGIVYPGPLFNATTNYSVVVRVFNHLDDPLLLTWSGPPGIQMQRHLWQDGLPGTHFLRDGTLLTSFRWKIKLEASALPYSTSREHLLSFLTAKWYNQDHKICNHHFCLLSAFHLALLIYTIAFQNLGCRMESSSWTVSLQVQQ